jgi:enamine deaminase RidA (YjgF/YER057c/UK114 family)
MNAETRLQALGLALPPPPQPVARYVPAVRVGAILFTSGILPLVQGRITFSGKLGEDLSIEKGQEAARIAVLNGLSIIKEALGGLDRVERILKVTGYIASAEGFTQQPAVLDAASNLLVDLFGDSGRHARTAVGAAELPLGSPVELEFTVQVRV